MGRASSVATTQIQWWNMSRPREAPLSDLAQLSPQPPPEEPPSYMWYAGFVSTVSDGWCKWTHILLCLLLTCVCVSSNVPCAFEQNLHSVVLVRWLGQKFNHFPQIFYNLLTCFSASPWVIEWDLLKSSLWFWTYLVFAFILLIFSLYICRLVIKCIQI